MSNTYTPPGTIDFFNSSFSSNLIYYDYQVSTGTLEADVSVFANTNFTPNLINIPVAGDYIISVTTAAIALSANLKSFYKWVFTKTGQATINVADNSMYIFLPVVSQPDFRTMSRKVTFPVAGTWTLTSQWVINPGGGGGGGRGGSDVYVNAGDVYPWIVLVHALNPINAVNTQLTKFVDSNYKLMTNMDVNAWWGNLTNATVSGYATSIANANTSIANTNNELSATTSSIGILTTNVNDLSTNVSSLQNTVSGLTSISTISGGIRIKP